LELSWTSKLPAFACMLPTIHYTWCRWFLHCIASIGSDTLQEYSTRNTALFLLPLHGHGHSLALIWGRIQVYLLLKSLCIFFGWGEGVSTSTMERKPSFFWPLIFTLANQSKRQTPVPIRSFSACPVLCSAPAGSSPLTARTCRRSHEVSWAPRRGFRSGAR